MVVKPQNLLVIMSDEQTKVEELRRRANTVVVLMPQIAQHVELVGAVVWN